MKNSKCHSNASRCRVLIVRMAAGAISTLCALTLYFQYMLAKERGMEVQMLGFALVFETLRVFSFIAMGTNPYPQRLAWSAARGDAVEDKGTAEE